MADAAMTSLLDLFAKRLSVTAGDPLSDGTFAPAYLVEVSQWLECQMPDLITQAKRHRELEEQSRRLANQTDHDEFRVEYMKKPQANVSGAPQPP
jgi:hypothetical protein